MLPTLPPERWIACSSVSQVNIPNKTGMPLSLAQLGQAQTDGAIDVLVVRRFAANHRPQAEHRQHTARLRTSRPATVGISNAPGTQATSIASSATPCSRSVSSAPASSLPVTDSFYRATTIANRPWAPTGLREIREPS